MSIFRPTLVAGAAALLVATGAAAQSRQIPAPSQVAPVVLHSTTVHTVTDGTLQDGYVVIRDGVIVDVGRGAAPQVPGATFVDAGGLHVYPGLVAPLTTLGLVETSAVDVTNDHSELGRSTPEVRAAVAINPDTDHIPVTRANGILTAMVFPRGGLVSGRCSTIRLDGWTWEDLAIDPEAGLVVNWPQTEPIRASWMDKSEQAQRKEIRQDLENVDKFFDEAESYVLARDNDPDVPRDMRYEAMRPFLNGSRPLFVRASSAGQIESAIAWAQRRGLRIVIVGGHEADRVIPLLKANDVPVIIGGLHRLPGRRDRAYDEVFTLPLKLHEAGVDFCIAAEARTGSARDLNHQAATAAAYGLPREVALEAVTIDAAQILGLGEMLGSIEPGKAGTLIITTGDPLEITNDTLMAFIDGRRIDLGNRQKSLYEKYREKYRQLGLLD